METRATVDYLRHKIENIEQKDPTKLIVAFYGSVLIAVLAMIRHEWEPLSVLISAVDLGYLADWGIDIVHKSQANRAIIALEGGNSFEAIQEKHPSTKSARGLYVPGFMPLAAVFALGLILDCRWLGLSGAFFANLGIVGSVLLWTVYKIHSSEKQVIQGWEELPR